MKSLTLEEKKPLTLTYSLHASQRQVFADASRFVVLAAGRRFGKTVLAVTDIIITSLAKPKRMVWYVAPTYRQAEMIAWAMLNEMLPEQLIAKKDQTKLELKLRNGSIISLKGADNEDSLRGVGLDFVVMDEYGMMKPNVWQAIIRPMLTDTRGRALFIGTPAGKNHFYELFMKGERNETGYKSYRFGTKDNPFVHPDEIDQARSELTEHFFKQEYEASFEDFTGLIWPEFNQAQHVIEPYDIPAYYDSIGCIDPALTGTTAALFARISEKDELIITGEYYEQNVRVSDVSKVINGKVNRWLIDPASAHKNILREGKLYSTADEFADNGIHTSPAEHDVDAGINRVAEYFRNGRIKIFSTCKSLIYELERYRWAEERDTVLGISRPKPYKSLDHACDCLRYIVMSRQQSSSKPKQRSFDQAKPMAWELRTPQPVTSYEKFKRAL